MDIMDLWSRVAVVAVGLVFGAFAVFSPSWVWFKHQKLTILAVLLCGFGTVLICFSIFRTITVSAGLSGVQLQMTEIEAQLKSVRTALIETNDAIKSAQASLKVLPAGGIASAQDVRAVAAKLDFLEKASQMKFFELRKDTVGVAQKVDSVSAMVENLKDKNAGVIFVPSKPPVLPRFP